MKRILFIFYFLFFIFCEVFSQTGWFPLNSGTTVNLSKIQFVNSQTGWAGGFQSLPTQYTFIKTTNAGLSWFNQSQNFPIGNRVISLYFLDVNTGYVSGGEGLFKTTNGGNNFVTLPTLTFACIDCFFVNSMTGWVSTATGISGLYKTTDGGSNWIIQYYNSVPNYLYAFLHFENSNTGWCVTDSVIYKTSNGGSNWIVQNHPFIAANTFNGIFAVSTESAWAFGTSGTVLLTTNGGTNWISKNISNAYSVLSAYFVNSLTGYLSTDSKYIFKTTNNGTNWITQATDTAQLQNSIYFTSNDTGYVCGSQGRIFKTKNGGGTIGVKKINENIPERFYLFQNYPNPFNPTTKIQFSIPPFEGGQGGMTILKVYDILGKEVGALVNEKISPGTYEVTFNGSKLASGIYFYKLQSGDFIDKKKMILIK